MFLCRFVFIFLVSITVSACLGGGGGGSGGDRSETQPEPQLPTIIGNTDITVRGRVIDGYVSGATVYYDLDFDGDMDEGEPRGISGENGLFEVNVPQEIQDCIGYSPMVVDVPVGAIDEEQGEVAEAYQMAYPPKMVELDLNEQINITPLTSVLWNEIGVELFEEKPDAWLNCEQFIENQGKILEVSSLITEVISDVSQTYGLTADEIYTDFVAEQNSEISQTAMSLVPVLSRSLSETLALRSENADAWYVKVLFKQGDKLDNDGAYPDAWYKKTTIFGSEITYVKTEKASDDLSTVLRTILYGEVVNFQRNDADITVSYEFESRNGDDSPYTCDSKEQYTFSDSVTEYEVVNLVYKPADYFDDCEIESFSDEATGRYIFVDGTQYTYLSRPFDALNDWFDFLDNYEALNQTDAKVYADTLGSSQ